MGLFAFSASPTALTKLVAASSSTGVAATQVCTGGESHIYLSNPCTVQVYVAIGTSSVQASVPTTATPATGTCIPSGGYRVFGGNGINWGWVSALTSAGTTGIPGVFATPGFGL